MNGKDVKIKLDVENNSTHQEISDALKGFTFSVYKKQTSGSYALLPECLYPTAREVAKKYKNARSYNEGSTKKKKGPFQVKKANGSGEKMFVKVSASDMADLKLGLVSIGREIKRRNSQKRCEK